MLHIGYTRKNVKEGVDCLPFVIVVKLIEILVVNVETCSLELVWNWRLSLSRDRLGALFRSIGRDRRRTISVIAIGLIC